jgi:hypothetical protein
MSLTLRVLLVGLSALLISPIAMAHLGGLPGPLALAAAIASAAPAAGDQMAKVSPELKALYQAYLATQGTGAPLVPPNPRVRVVEDRVVIDAVASGSVGDLQAQLVALGLQKAAHAGRIVSGQLPISAIAAMAALPDLAFARAAMSMTRGDAVKAIR